MADSFVQLPADSTGKKIDTRTEGTNSEHRQVMVIGDPATNAGVAPVDGTKGLSVDLSNTGANTNKLLVTPDLPSGASTAANQSTANTSLSSINGKLVTAVTDDYDTGAGTDTVQSIGLALPASGGHVVGGTSSNPLRTDPTGTTTQPVSGTITTSPPSHASTNVDQLNGTTIDTNSGAKSAGTQRVVIATDQPALTNALKVDGSGVTQPVSGTVTANAGTNLNTSALALETGGNLATIATNTSAPTTVRYGQATVSVTNTAVQLSNQACSAVIVQALAANAGNVVIGDSSVTTANGFQLQPGQAAGIAISNVNKLYVNGIAGDGVCWIGS